jgi:hypothetical protein
VGDEVKTSTGSARGIYLHVPHPHIAIRKGERSTARQELQVPQGVVQRVNAFLAVKITGAVGTMWCAYLFAAIALISLPDAIQGGIPTIIAWIAQTFLQLVLLSIIIVGQKISSAASERRAQDTYNDAEAVLHEAIQIQEHLAAQDEVLSRLVATLTPHSGE